MIFTGHNLMLLLRECKIKQSVALILLSSRLLITADLQLLTTALQKMS